MDVDARLRIEQLERANAELRRANARLAREWLGKSDSAAAALLANLEAQCAELEAQLERADRVDPEAAQRRALIERVEELHAQVLAQDRQLREITSTRAWRIARRYWSVRDAAIRALRPQR